MVNAYNIKLAIDVFFHYIECPSEEEENMTEILMQLAADGSIEKYKKTHGDNISSSWPF